MSHAYQPPLKPQLRQACVEDHKHSDLDDGERDATIKFMAEQDQLSQAAPIDVVKLMNRLDRDMKKYPPREQTPYHHDSVPDKKSRARNIVTETPHTGITVNTTNHQRMETSSERKTGKF